MGLVEKCLFLILLATLAVPKSEELFGSESPYRHGSKEKSRGFFS